MDIVIAMSVTKSAMFVASNGGKSTRMKSIKKDVNVMLNARLTENALYADGNLYLLAI